MLRAPRIHVEFRVRDWEIWGKRKYKKGIKKTLEATKSPREVFVEEKRKTRKIKDEGA